jgi:hypothetical protein
MSEILDELSKILSQGPFVHAATANAKALLLA